MKTKINGIDLYYAIHGSGEPVLFVHGFPLSGRLWEQVVEPLQDGYRLIIPDLRGLGRSEVSAEGSIGLFADDLAALIDALEERRPVVVVGLSMGGYIAFEFFRRQGGRVRALVLADTQAQAYTPEAARDREALARRVEKEGSIVAADWLIDKLFGPKASQELRDTWWQIMSSSAPVGVVAALRAMIGRADSRPTLASISVPALVVVGEHDAITPLDDAQTMHRGIVGSRLEVIPGAGHMTPVEQPDRFVRVLREFLDSLGGSGR